MQSTEKMAAGAQIFERFPDFIREFIYRNNWESLREIQIAAAQTLFDTEHHLLLTSSTASGKTEAVFFPVLAQLYQEKPSSIGVLYIAPLKSLINDQFYRMEELLDESGIPVTHWHGDVSVSHKRRLLEKPEGILQITPESLEAMLMRRSSDIVRMFCDLRYVIVDEIHTLMGTDRGSQIICQLTRLNRLIGRDVRRIGLSATVGDVALAAKWLAGDSPILVDTPALVEGKQRWRLAMEHFFIQTPKEKQASTPDNEKSSLEKLPLDAGYEYMYDCVKDRKALVFSNSREETEAVTATLRQIAAKRGEPDVFLIHHGNLSAAIREEAESRMKEGQDRCVTCATVTLELGIDIGRLERVLQNEAPRSVSSFLQRLGRSGRRGQAPEMLMVFREEDALPNTPLPQLIPWELLQAIAIVQLYLEERFIEPPSIRQMPLSLLFHQTISTVASSGELSAKRLAEKILSLPPFADVSREDYRELLISMVRQDYLEMTEEKTLIVGLRGERLIKSFKFYAVFKDSEDYTVRCGSDEIGTITTPVPVGDRFALAGRVWEVEELDIEHKLVYVKGVQGKMEISWPGDYGEIHTRILERMHRVLCEDVDYPYLKSGARQRLLAARRVAKNAGLEDRPLIHLGGGKWCLFPWLGTRSFRTCRKYLQANAGSLGISGIECDGSHYLTFRMDESDARAWIGRLADRIRSYGVDTYSLVQKGEMPVFEKYDDCIPAELLRRAYAKDRLCADEWISRVNEWEKE